MCLQVTITFWDRFSSQIICGNIRTCLCRTRYWCWKVVLFFKKKGHFGCPPQLDTLDTWPQVMAVSMLLLYLLFIGHGPRIEQLLFCDRSIIYLISPLEKRETAPEHFAKTFTLPASLILSLNLITDCDSMRHSDITLFFIYLEGLVCSYIGTMTTYLFFTGQNLQRFGL